MGVCVCARECMCDCVCACVCVCVFIAEVNVFDFLFRHAGYSIELYCLATTATRFRVEDPIFGILLRRRTHVVTDPLCLKEPVNEFQW